jgi:hypothetical protein
LLPVDIAFLIITQNRILPQAACESSQGMSKIEQQPGSRLAVS